MHTNKLEEKKHDNPPKLKQKAADLSDTGVISDQATGQGAESLNGEQHEDSFQRMYSKELDLDEDEVPIILHELNDSAIHFISRDQYERALSLLQKAQTLIDRNPNDRFIVLLTMHNMALCFQKLGALEECAICLEASLQSINSPFLIPKFQGDPSRKLKKLKYECKAHMQVCALLSQLHRHKEALIHAEKSVMIAQYMVNDLLSMCQFYQGKILAAKKNEQIAQELMMIDDPHQQNPQNKDLIYYDDSISMLERTAYRILPIIQEVASRMIKTTNEDQNERKKNIEISDLMKQKLNMKAVLGYLNQSEWLYLLNIGNIMQITPLTVHDLYSNQTFEVELTRDAILEKISFLAVSYFCMSTELRFLVQVKDDPTIDPLLKKKESEYWHAKALEISCSFLPSESPLVSHILTSYQKHHAPVQHEIPEDQEQLLDLKVIRPLQGIDICKFQPMVRQDEALNISIPQLPLSPNNYANRRRQSIDNKTTQILSLPFSPNNQGTTANASQNNLFSSQLGQKIQTTDSSTSNLVPSQRQTSSTNNGGNSSINLQQQQQKSVNRFNKNRISGGGQGNKKNINNNQQFTNISSDGIEVNQQVLEDIDDNDDHNTQYLLTNDQGNKSMMDIVPSQNYKKLLNDFSNIQNSTDILEELENGEIQESKKQKNIQNSQLFELCQEEIVSDNDDENDFIDINNQTNYHQESQEVEIVMDEMNKLRKKHQQVIKSGSTNSAQRRGVKNGEHDLKLYNQQLQQNYNRAVQNRSQLQNQILDISQDYIQDDDDESQEDDSLDEDQFFDDARGSHSRSKQQLRMQNNLSMDGARMRRPQTSQGIRKNFKQINHHNMIHHTDSNNTMRNQQNYNNHSNNRQQQQQLQDLNMIKANTALGMIPSADGVSPNNAILQRGGILGNRQIHNQSAAAVSGKISKNQTFANGFNMSNNISGNQTDIQAGSTPVKSASIGGRANKGSAKYNRENMNMSRANLDSRTHQSSSIDQMQQQQRPNSKQKRLRNIQDQNNSAGQGVNTTTTTPLIANQMPQITNQPNNKRSIQGALTQLQMQSNNNTQQQQIINNNLTAHTQLNSHNHSQMIVINNSNANTTTTVRALNNGSNTVQGFYNSQQQQQQQQRSNSQTKKQHLSYSGGKQRGAKHNIGNTSDGFKQQNQQLQLQLIQQQQSQKYMTAGGIEQQNSNNSIQQNQKTLQDLFMIDRLIKKRGTNHNTHEQTNNNKSFEMIVSSATNNTDPKYNSQHLHNSNSRSKSRSKLTTSRSKDKHQSASGTINNISQQQKLKQNNINSGIFLKNPNGNINSLNSQSVLNTSSSVLINGQNSLLDIQSQQQQQNIEELKRQILLKQALLDSSKNSRRKSTGNLNTSASLGNNSNQVQLTQQKKRIENVNQSMTQQQSNSLQQTQQNTQQQWLSAQLSGQKQSSSVSTNNNIVNTHQMIKKFLKDRQTTQQQSTSSISQQQQLLNNSLINQVSQPLIGNNNQVFSLNNSMLENYPINNQNQLLQSNNKNNGLQQPNLFAPDLSAYKMQLSKKIMQQQQKLLGASQQDTFQMNNGSGGNGVSKRQGGKKSGNGQYITESHPKQQQRSATPVFEMYDSVNGQSRTQKQITQSNSLGMYMSSNLQQQPLQKKDKSLIDIGNFHIQNNNNINQQQNLAQYLKDYQSVQQQQDFQNQSLREDSFIKSMKKKNSKKTTPKNVINNQFSIV